MPEPPSMARFFAPLLREARRRAVLAELRSEGGEETAAALGNTFVFGDLVRSFLQPADLQ